MSLSPEELKAKFQRLGEEVWNKRDLSILEEFYVPEYEITSWGVKGLEGIKQVFQGLWEAFPDLHFTMQEFIAAGDKVVTRWLNHGTQHGPFLGYPSHGKEADTAAVMISRVNSEGKIVEDWILSDNLGLLQQLGAIPIHT